MKKAYSPTQNRINEIKGILMDLSLRPRRGDSLCGYQAYNTACEMVEFAERTFRVIRDAAIAAGNDFICAIGDTIAKYGRCSEKQAYCLARFATEQKIVFGFDPEDFAEYGFED